MRSPRRALLPVLPTREEFPYAIRQLSEAMGSNGSTSMGSVCASTLSLLQAGVPLRAPVAGIAMGLISGEVDGETQYVALTDILGAEDAFGDMDFKVAGTREFVTALQLDTKLDGIPAEVLAAALTQAQRRPADDPRRDGRGHRRARGDVGLRPADHHASRSRSTRSARSSAPRARSSTRSRTTPAPSSRSRTTAPSTSVPPTARRPRPLAHAVNAIANPTMPEVGERYLGTVVKTTNFGAFVSLLPGKDGLLHISKLRALAGGKRVDNVEDVVSVGQKIQVEIAEIDDRGKLSLIPVVEDDADAADTESATPRT